MFIAKRATFIATGYSTDRKKIVGEEYDNIEFEPRYSHAYFSIDFDLTITRNNQCFFDICGEGLLTDDGVQILTDDGEKIFVN